MITVLCCRGIGEALDVNMLTNTTRHLDLARFVVKQVPWRAQYGPVPSLLGESFDKATAEGRKLLLEMIADDPNPVVLLGYSGGAAVAGDVATEIAKGLHRDLDIRAVGLVADPFRSPLNSVNEGASGWGIAGQRAISGRFPLWQLADPRDAIPNCPANSPLRTFADESAAFSLIDPAAWTIDLFERIWGHRRQNVSPNLDDYSAAIFDVEGYLWCGDHVSYHLRSYPGTDRSYCEWLADRINEVQE
jgi:hypothetical protein